MYLPLTHAGDFRSNRTFMELKSQFNFTYEQVYPSSNRTFMELKFLWVLGEE